MQQLSSGSLLQGGKYKIEKVLGQGGFGITYLASQELLDRKVCIKEFFYKEYCERDEATSHVTLGTQSNREVVERFMSKFIKEARTISQLNHSHIIRIHDIFKENNTAYYVMEYIEGESLAERVNRDGMLSEAEEETKMIQAEVVKKVGQALSTCSSAEDLYQKGMKYYENSLYAKAISYLKKAAEQGHARAQCYLGICYYNGEGVGKNWVKAVEWYRKAAEQGHARAQCYLGICYENGEGVEKNPVKAVEWWGKAAEQGHVDAQFNLGLCYENGEGVEKNPVKAVEWWKKAAEQGHVDAQYCLGFCYAHYEGVEGEPKKAIKWYMKAAEQGHIGAQYELGICYQNGIGIDKDSVEAVDWYMKAAEQGDADAQYKMGVCYYDGVGVDKDSVKAAEWWKKAAEQGHEIARERLKRYNYKKMESWIMKKLKF